MDVPLVFTSSLIACFTDRHQAIGFQQRLSARTERKVEKLLRESTRLSLRYEVEVPLDRVASVGDVIIRWGLAFNAYRFHRAIDFGR